MLSLCNICVLARGTCVVGSVLWSKSEEHLGPQYWCGGENGEQSLVLMEGSSGHGRRCLWEGLLLQCCERGWEKKGLRETMERSKEPLYMRWCELRWLTVRVPVVSDPCWQCVPLLCLVPEFCVCFFGSFWSLCLHAADLSSFACFFNMRDQSQVMLKQRFDMCGQTWSVLLCHQILQFQEVWPVRLFGYQPV